MQRRDPIPFPDDRRARFEARWGAARRRAVEDALRRLPADRAADPEGEARLQAALAAVATLGVGVAHHLVVAGAGPLAHLAVLALNGVALPIPFLVAWAGRRGPRRAWLAACLLWAPVAPALLAWRVLAQGASVGLLPTIGLVTALLALGVGLLAHAHLAVVSARDARARRVAADRARLLSHLA